MMEITYISLKGEAFLNF
uniref:Uncharacterized protein n=1 Tax=Anguilla anguilla TaxID=7936 RepID=A0A0E9STE5_ANGAN